MLFVPRQRRKYFTYDQKPQKCRLPRKSFRNANFLRGSDAREGFLKQWFVKTAQAQDANTYLMNTRAWNEEELPE